MKNASRRWTGLLLAFLCASTCVVAGEQPASAADGAWERIAWPEGYYSFGGRDTELSAASPDQVWIVLAGAPWRFDGQTWSTHPVTTESGAEVKIDKISALPDGSTWASGTVYGTYPNPALPWSGRWDGTTWVEIAPPQQVGLDKAVQQAGLEALAPDDVWELYWVGSISDAGRAAVLHYDGTSWTRYALRGPGCVAARVYEPSMIIRRGQPVVVGRCVDDVDNAPSSSGSSFLWELKGDRWADRGPVADLGPSRHHDIGVLPGGALVEVVQRDRFGPFILRQRRSSGEWFTRSDDIGLEGVDDMAVDPTNGAVLALGPPQSGAWRQRELRTFNRARSGSRLFDPRVLLSHLDVDPVSGTRWILGDFQRYTRSAPVLYRRVPAAS